MFHRMRKNLRRGFEDVETDGKDDTGNRGHSYKQSYGHYMAMTSDGTKKGTKIYEKTKKLSQKDNHPAKVYHKERFVDGNGNPLTPEDSKGLANPFKDEDFDA
eukprot:TRINITY_DN3256_c0_g1_i3.p2 TRINITY_DN3256_c0_g1~~TRINITY_DN3256_c0_g1_i3.p2  ORF type:complete len:103 (-),score=29.53 TRINITY_DN3256_c0_g1_i3:153-461(-)